jgi:uncharacterized protein (UPF0276 family)
MTPGAIAQGSAVAHGSGGAIAQGSAVARAVPYLGHGVGLRVPHYARALQGALDVDWVEVITENFFGGGGRPRAVLEAVRRERPLVFHGVSLGVGSLGPPDPDYLRQVKLLADSFEPAWLSDHVCWTRQGGRYSHELLPLPFTPEALGIAVENTQRAQDYLKRALVLENVSSYVSYRHGDLTEWEFLGELSRRSGCSLLLDLNNVLVSAHNHGFSANEYLAALPADRVAQFHLANHSQHAGYKFDDHRGPVPVEVWQLFEAAVARFGDVSSLVEWDEDVPAWEVLVAERDQAAARASRVRGGLERERGQARGQGAASERAGPKVARSGTARAGQPRPAPALERTQQLFMRALTWPQGARDFAESAGDDVRRDIEQTFAGGDETRPVTSDGQASSRQASGRQAAGNEDLNGSDRGNGGLVQRGLDAVERLDIYANAYFYRLLDALRELFPRLAYLAGEIPFHNLVTDYLLECPSTAPDLRRLGDRLPGFSRRHGSSQGSALLSEVAELELALAAALDAPDAPRGQSLTRAGLAQRSPDTWPALTLAPAPSTRHLSALHDLEHIARLCDAGQRQLALDIGPRTEPVTILVGRRAHAAYFRSLEPNEALALQALDGATRFDTLCEVLARRGAPPTRLVDYLLRWVDDGVIIEARSTSS